MARTRAVDYDEKRTAILTKAARLFATKGFDRASMAAVAAACGVSKALLYHYYDSKEALLYDILHAHLEDLVQATEAAYDPKLPPRERLGALIAGLLATYEDADAEHKVQINDLGALPDEQQERLRAMERKLVEVFSTAVIAINPALGGGPGRRLLKPVVMSLFGMLNWHYMWFRPGGPVSREEFARLATTLIIEGAEALP